ncbi:MAG: hypothetical protein ACFFGZ_15715 [Candidatus Thorarchaeota archaeon]
MHKLEVIGNPRTLNKTTGVLTELDCVIRMSKPLYILPVGVEGKEALILIGKHEITTGYASNFRPVDISLWIGHNGTFAKNSAPVSFLSEEMRVQALDVLRRYQMMTANEAIPLGVDGVFGFAKNGKNLLALRASSYP